MHSKLPLAPIKHPFMRIKHPSTHIKHPFMHSKHPFTHGSGPLWACVFLSGPARLLCAPGRGRARLGGCAGGVERQESDLLLLFSTRRQDVFVFDFFLKVTPYLETNY